ncbi:transketolase [Deinococcus aestuarii]|uniref:transketolase n=1 Tax=Deinococcus aestuarii TaxID=2774531 RepID=UPI001FE378BD|nr:transketolase [Deinococcus aestuarii]
MTTIPSIRMPVRPARLASLDAAEREEQARALSRSVRLSVLEMIEHAGLGHIGGDFSVTDILATLFSSVLHVRPQEHDWPERDRFILSKGHAAAALYAALAHSGFFPVSALGTFMDPLSMLNGHPNRNKVLGIETNTGPLGHGLPVAVGCAIASELSPQPWRTYVVLGDGELQEGSNWEAIMTAAHRRLGTLTAVVDRNRLQQGARTEDTNSLEPLADKWRAFGWEVHEVDGHDHAALYEVFSLAPGERPRCVIAHTVKGKGVSFIEDRVEWHHKVPSREQVEQARKELEA